ncbi:MFS transporter [Rhodococcus erythropolis]
MTTRNDTSAPPSSSLSKVGGATLVGSFIEWYDFYIYGIAAALVFNKLFFPNVSAAAGTILSFAVFASAWMARPLGSIIFGSIGDRIGPKRALVMTFILMGGSTVGVGLVPTAESIGVLAPIILVLFRILQGLAAGGEWSGAATMAVGHAPAGKRGLYGALPQMGIPLALIAANLVTLLSYQVPEEILLTWGWRIPFLSSIIIIPVGYYIRRRLVEAPDYVTAVKNKQISQSPVRLAVTQYWKQILVVVLFMGAGNAFFFVFTTYALTYATTEVGFSRPDTLSALAIAASVFAVATLFFGWASDIIGRRRLFIVGVSILAIMPFPLFALINTGSWVLFTLGLSVSLGLGHGSFWGPAAAFFTEIFPPSVRYSGSGLGFQLAGTLFGGPLPLIAAALVSAANGAPWYVAALVSAICIPAVIAAFYSKRLHVYGPDDTQENSDCAVDSVRPAQI